MNLQQFFTSYPKAALAFSGGVDSSYLLYAALQHAEEVMAFYVDGPFQPQFEKKDAFRLAEELGADLHVIPVDILSNEKVTANEKDRCYHCKSLIFTTILQEAKALGYPVLLDGTNASDDFDDRPGMRALEELKVLSPLRLAGLTKEDVRRLSKEANLFTWDKPAYSCLATRIPTGTNVTKEGLERTERAEDFLFSLGFTDFRVRTVGNAAKIQLPESQMEKLLHHRKDILRHLNVLYDAVWLDLEGR